MKSRKMIKNIRESYSNKDKQSTSSFVILVRPALSISSLDSNTSIISRICSAGSENTLESIMMKNI